MRKISIILLLLAITIQSYSQQIEIYGYVYDAQTGEKLIGANVYDSLTNNGTNTNSHGFYSIKIDKQSRICFQASYVGYNTFSQYLRPDKSIQIDIKLTPGVALQQVVVRNIKPIEQRLEVGLHVLTPQTCKMLPAATGESDIFKVIQLLPGVQSGDEGTNGLNVRGGSSDQNLIMLDGVALYNPNHLGGFISLFHTEVINNVTLIKAGFPARYGGRLSSVVDVRTKDGNLRKSVKYAQIGILTSSIYAEGPIKKDTSSYLLSVRRSLFDILLYRPLLYFDSKAPLIFTYGFYDLNFKFNHRLSPRTKLLLSSYYGDDIMSTKIRTKDSDATKAGNGIHWGNAMTSVKLNHVFNSKTFGNIIVSASRYRFKNEIWAKGKDFESNYLLKSKISDIQWLNEFEYLASNRWQINAGGGAIYHSFIPVDFSIYNNDYGKITQMQHNGYSPKAIEPYAYIENKYTSKKLDANIGLRVTQYVLQTHSFSSVEPRIILNFPLPQKSAIKISYAKMQQPIHYLTNSGVGSPIDYWVPATKKLPPSVSHQASISWVKTYKSDYEISFDVYSKQMKNLVELAEGVGYLGVYSDWESEVVSNGKGTSNGIECFIEKKYGEHRGWIAYTLSKTTRQFEQLNNGKVYPFKYDRRHDISIVYMYTIKKNWDFSATWVYGTGNAITLSKAKYSMINDNQYRNDNNTTTHQTHQAEIYGEKNSYRMRAYHRMDIGINHTKQTKRGEARWSYNIYNVYARQNPYYYYWENSKLYQLSMFGFTPSISYGFYF